MKLYALAVNGLMFYFEGDIPADKYPDVNNIAASIPCNRDCVFYDSFIQQFIDRVSSELGVVLTHKKIENVFRKLW